MVRRLAIAIVAVLFATIAACGGSSNSGSDKGSPSDVTIATGTTAAPGTTPGTTAPGTTATGAAACTGTRRDRTVAYAQHDGAPVGRTSLDLYLPPSPRCAPVFVFVHGGAYCCGDKSNDIVGPASWLTRNGFIVASVNYRLTQGRGAVTFPDFENDVADAVGWLRTHIGEWGGDGSRIVLAGHSTGGEMVALIGSDPAILQHGGLETTSLRCVVVLDAGTLDMNAALARGGNISLYTQAFGTKPSEWSAANATEQAARGAVVKRWFVALRPGEKPPKLAMQQAFVATLRRVGADVTTVDASSIGHAQVINDIGRAGDTLMTEPIARFLAGCVA
jgi:arylformamidase